MVKEFKVEIFGVERRAFIYLPADYGMSGKRFPVMYMFDGQNLFFDEDATYGKSWGLKDYLDRTKTPLIVAAAECNREGNKRLSEYSPVDFTFGEKIKGRGKRYLDWLVGEFKPYIDGNFSTLPERANTAVGGSSMGGLMTIYALAKYNKYFSRGAALSPSLWVGGGEVLPFVANGRFGKDTVLYMDYGSKEFKNHAVQKKAFADTVARLTEKNVLLASRIVPGGTHSEASWEKQIPFYMQILGFKPKE